MQSDLTTSQQALRRAASLLGGQAALAAALRFKSRRNVWPWFNTGRQVPAEYCPAIERVTAGAVRCEELRPDVDWHVLRSTTAPQAQQETDRAAA